MSPELSRRLAYDFNMPSFTSLEFRQRILAAAVKVETWEELPHKLRMEIIEHEFDRRTWSQILAEERMVKRLSE
jgi:hypothetical protein